jgi:FKBP-type peptidyl-prolyl cis-trans isomerase
MEKLAAGFEKQKVVCVTNSFKEVKVKGRKRKTVAVHYEGSLENGKFLTLRTQENQSNLD